jgi:hypothetical protein
MGEEKQRDGQNCIMESFIICTSSWSNILVFKSRMCLMEHVEGMRHVCRAVMGKAAGKRLLGKHRLRWNRIK